MIRTLPLNAVIFALFAPAALAQDCDRPGSTEDWPVLATGRALSGICNFSEGLAALRFQGNWGYVDTAGRVAIAPRFKDAGPFAEGLALRYDAAAGFAEGFAPVIEGGAIGIIDKRGRWLLKSAERCGQEVVTDRSGRIVLPPGLACPGTFADGDG